MTTHNWCKQIFLSQIPIYPAVSLIINGFRGDSFWSGFYVDRVKYDVSEENLELFEKELIKINDTMEMPFEDIKLTISPSYSLSDEVYGITGFRYGADYVFPVRMLVKTVPDFREHLKQIVEGATGFEFNEECAKLVTDKDIQNLILSDTAKSFMFRRSIVKSTSYQMFTMKYVIWGVCVTCCYGVYILLSKILGPIIPLPITIAMNFTLFYLFNQTYSGTQELEYDRKVYTADKDYVEGCKEFLTSCINFGLLMNKLVKPNRGRAFTADGNPTNSQVPYTTRLELVNAYAGKQESAEKAKKLRQLEEEDAKKK